MPELSSSLAAFQEEDVISLVERESTLILNRCSSPEYPQATLLAGQPGAGKTVLSAMLLSRFDHGAAFLNGDDYRRYHPNYRRLYAEYGSDSVQMTSAFSSAVTEQLIGLLSDHGRNLVIEGTGRTIEVPKTTAERLATKGYHVEMAIIAARPEVSLASTLRRFYQMNEQGTIPRATALTAHDMVVSALPSNLDLLLTVASISRITIWDRELTLLFDSQKDFCKPSEILLAYWNRPWTAEEMRMIRQQVNELSQKEQKQKLGQQNVIDQLICRIEAADQMVDSLVGPTMG